MYEIVSQLKNFKRMRIYLYLDVRMCRISKAATLSVFSMIFGADIADSVHSLTSDWNANMENAARAIVRETIENPFEVIRANPLFTNQLGGLMMMMTMRRKWVLSRRHQTHIKHRRKTNKAHTHIAYILNYWLVRNTSSDVAVARSDLLKISKLLCLMEILWFISKTLPSSFRDPKKTYCRTHTG